MCACSQCYFYPPLKRIRHLLVRFDADIQAHELPAFRGAVIAKAGTSHVAFHNHLGDEKFLYRYPVIQYKRIGRNPAIICLEEGVDEIHHLFQNPSWDVRLGDRSLTLQVKDLRLNQYTLQAWEHTFSFRIRDWLALNPENYSRFIALTDELDRLELLERILTGNLLSLAKGLDWRIDRPVRVRIDQVSPPSLIRFKDQLLTGFDAVFRSNVFLPDWIGLGKGVSQGFGVITRSREDRRETGQKQNGQSTIPQDDEY